MLAIGRKGDVVSLGGGSCCGLEREKRLLDVARRGSTVMERGSNIVLLFG